MPRATSWEPRHTTDPTPQHHDIRNDTVREIPRLNGPQFRARRTSLGLGHAQVAEVCEVTTRTITRWEHSAAELVPLSGTERLQAVAEAGDHFYGLIADHGEATIYSYGWRTLPEFGLCLPETWWHTVVGMVPGITVKWAKGHPAAQPNNEAARKTARKAAATKSTTKKNGTAARKTPAAKKIAPKKAPAQAGRGKSAS